MSSLKFSSNAEFFELLREAIFKDSIISINGENYKVQRSFHVTQPRNPESKVPRDGNMSRNKYSILLNFLPKDLNNTDFAIIWTNKGFANGIAGEINNDTITIITAIMREKLNKKNKIFSRISNRYDIGEQKI